VSWAWEINWIQNRNLQNMTQPHKVDAVDGSIAKIQKTFRSTWRGQASEKARRYIGKFYALERFGQQIIGKVEGNYGVYNVSIWIEGSQVFSSCGCYIGKYGGCHHCEALVHTFFKDPDAFVEVKAKGRTELSRLSDLPDYLKTTTLEALLTELKANGMSQKAFAESIGMNPRHLGAVKSSEKRNHYFNELGAIKLACLWALEHLREK
jgi:uncharacterized Zn finger protein